MSLRSEVKAALQGQNYFWFRCNGKNCDYQEVFLEGMEPACPTPKCRGRMVQGRPPAAGYMLKSTLAWFAALESAGKWSISP